VNSPQTPIDVRRVERIVREVIMDFGFACTLTEVHSLEGRWRITVRNGSGRVITFEAAGSTAAHVRDWVIALLDQYCGD
jgi:hypothetical protein